MPAAAAMHTPRAAIGCSSGRLRLVQRTVLGAMRATSPARRDMQRGAVATGRAGAGSAAAGQCAIVGHASGADMGRGEATPLTYNIAQMVCFGQSGSPTRINGAQ
jgi:hypothetical protein